MDEFGHLPQPTNVRCPFYGFSWPAASTRLVYEGGNRCGLALDRNEPCTMEAAGCRVDMRVCPMAERMAYFIRSAKPVIAFATAQDPEGVPFAEWWRRTMVHRAMEVPPEQWSPGQHPEMRRDSRSGD